MPNHDDSNTADCPAHTVEISPNCSLTPRQAWLFYGWVSVASLSLAGLFALQGYWPVLPFAGLELAVLGIALLITMKRGRYREVISISSQEIVVERGEADDREEQRFPRAWAQVRLESARARTHPSRLLISAHGKGLEVGACLTESERTGLFRRLRELVKDPAVPAKNR
ncbi:MAG: DUF2244 domain-containing protein [Pseudomonadota bacterium]